MPLHFSWHFNCHVEREEWFLAVSVNKGRRRALFVSALGCDIILWVWENSYSKFQEGKTPSRGIASLFTSNTSGGSSHSTLWFMFRKETILVSSDILWTGFLLAWRTGVQVTIFWSFDCHNSTQVNFLLYPSGAQRFMCVQVIAKRMPRYNSAIVVPTLPNLAFLCAHRPSPPKLGPTTTYQIPAKILPEPNMSRRLSIGKPDWIHSVLRSRLESPSIYN